MNLEYSHLLKPEISEREISEKINNINWHHTIPITDSIRTDGYVHLENQKIKIQYLPKDLTGKSVLEIGPKHGFYSIEAKNRNADSVTAIDINPERKKAFSILNNIFKFDINLIIDDFLDHEFDTKFDVVICFGVLHYIQDQRAFLDKISGLAIETICIEHPVTPSLLDRSFRYLPEQREKFGWYRRRIDSIADYQAPIPSKRWIEEEITKKGFDLVQSDTHVGVILQNKIPVTTAVPAPHRFLPCRYIAQADQGRKEKL